MPLLRVTTNQPIESGAKAQFLKQASSETASMLGKPESYVMVILEQNPDMLFAGTVDPLALVELKSLGLPHDKTAEFSTRLCSLISDQLNISQDRIYIEFSDPPRHFWGWNGTTF
ncbi:MAG: phenylpyruvate tautomerase MIF-related protein [Chromatiales bacterium]|jgi:phenylpyruvate tautomerase PptA (4-oxalocrotonate tautomerase family)